MILFVNTNSHFRYIITANIWEISKDTIFTAKQYAKKQIIKICMNINRIINKYIISKYVKRENKPG